MVSLRGFGWFTADWEITRKLIMNLILFTL
jgi:hypothetical protein